MTGFWSIYRREVLSLWVTPLAWVLITVFLILQGSVYYSIVSHFSSLPELSVDYGPVQAYFGQTLFVLVSLLLLCPALTMRTFAEERRSGTIETLLTAPSVQQGWCWANMPPRFSPEQGLPGRLGKISSRRRLAPITC